METCLILFHGGTHLRQCTHSPKIGSRQPVRRHILGVDKLVLWPWERLGTGSWIYRRYKVWERCKEILVRLRRYGVLKPLEKEME